MRRGRGNNRKPITVRNYVFNVIKPLSKDKRQKVSVSMAFVLADSQEEAERAVAREHRRDCFGQYRIAFRNSWEAGEVINWGFQSWERGEFDVSIKTAREILGDEYQAHLDSFVVKSLKEAGKSDEEIRQIAFEHEAKMIAEMNY
jgi:hypothetical protein